MALLTVKIKKGAYDELKSSENFIIAIQLARIVNSLRSNLRSYLNVKNKNNVIATKDRMDLMLIHASMLYEAIREISKNGKNLRKIKLDEKSSSDIAMLRKELGDKTSFTNTILKRIRNKIFFHFDRDIIASSIEKYDFGASPTFAIGTSKKRQDVVYSFVDDLILSDLINISAEEGAPYSKYDKIEKKIIDISDRLCSVFDNIIRTILHEKLIGFKD